MLHKRHDKRRAFTLIELLTAMVVLSMLAVLLFMAFSNTSRIMNLGSNQMERNQVVRAVLQQIERDLERTAYSSTAINMYQATGAVEVVTGLGISNTTLYCLSALASEEGNALGTVVNVGYQVAQISETNFGVAVRRWALQRGDDAYVDPVTYPASWWSSSTANPSFWKTLSDNVLGIAFQFYTNADNYVTTWNSTTNFPNQLPTSIGVTIWAIDNVNYNLALSLDQNLILPAAQQLITKNVHRYTSRVFLPQSTQN